MILTDAELASLTEAVTQALAESGELAKAAGLDRADVMLRVTHAAQDILTHAETIQAMDPADRDEAVAKWTADNPLRKAVWDTLGRKVIGAAQGAADAYMAGARKAGAMAQRAGRQLGNRLAATNAHVESQAAHQRAAAPHLRRALQTQAAGREAARTQAYNAALASGNAAGRMAGKLAIQRQAPLVRQGAKMAGRIGAGAFHGAAGLAGAGAAYAGYRLARGDNDYRKADAGDLGKGIRSAAPAAAAITLKQIGAKIQNGTAAAGEFARAHAAHLGRAAWGIIPGTAAAGALVTGAPATAIGAGAGALAGLAASPLVAMIRRQPVRQTALDLAQNGAMMGATGGAMIGAQEGMLQGALLGAAAVPFVAGARHGAQIGRRLGGDRGALIGGTLGAAAYLPAAAAASIGYRRLSEKEHAQRVAAAKASAEKRRSRYRDMADEMRGHADAAKAEELPLDALYKAAPAELQDDLALLPASVQEQALADLREILIEFDELARSLDGASMEKVEATVTDYLLTGDVELKKFLPALLAGAGGLAARAAPYAARAIAAVRSGGAAVGQAGAAIASRASRIAGNPALGARYGRAMGNAAMGAAARLPGQAAYGARVGYRFGRAKLGQALRSPLARRIGSAATKVGMAANVAGLGMMGADMLSGRQPQVR